MDSTAQEAFFDELQKIADLKKNLALMGGGAVAGALGLKGLQTVKQRYDIGKMVEEQQNAAPQE
jgi:hypothetical protein